MSDTTTPTTAATATTEAPAAEATATHAVSTNTNTEAHPTHPKEVLPENTTGSSIFPINPQFTKVNQLIVPTWGLLSTLVACFFILKFFIYIKDDKRHGK
ncbi:MAG: hypothetical protein ACOYL6_05455 [Bacteriovoracaceae bacterium]